MADKLNLRQVVFFLMKSRCCLIVKNKNNIKELRLVLMDFFQRVFIPFYLVQVNLINCYTDRFGSKYINEILSLGIDTLITELKQHVLT